MEKGLTHTSRTVVNVEHCASTMGSGELPVFATPALIALMENAAMLAVSSELQPGYTTVGGEINVQHLKPTMPGAEVTATAVLRDVEGRKLIFDVTAQDADGCIGRGSHVRFIVDGDRFMGKLKK